MKCEGYRRYGGAFTLGPVRWEQCKSKATVKLTFLEDGKYKTLPACNECWKECIANNMIIKKEVPL